MGRSLRSSVHAAQTRVLGAGREALFDPPEVLAILQVDSNQGAGHFRPVVNGLPQAERRLSVGGLRIHQRRARPHVENDHGGYEGPFHDRQLLGYSYQLYLSLLESRFSEGIVRGPVQPKFSLTEGSIPRALLSFSLPILFGNVLQSVNGSVNASGWASTWARRALAAAGNSNVVMFLLFGVMFGFSMAATVMVAQCVGGERYRGGQARGGHERAVLLGLSLVMSVLVFASTHLSARLAAYALPTCFLRRSPTCASFSWRCLSLGGCSSSWRCCAAPAIRRRRSSISSCPWRSTSR